MKRSISWSAAPLAAIVTLLLPPLVARSWARQFIAPPAAAGKPDSLKRPPGRPTFGGPGPRLPPHRPLLVRTAARPAGDPGTATTARPAGDPGSEATGCSRPVDDTDPIAVAGSVAVGIFCGAEPVAGVSRHGRQVLLNWSAVELPAGPATVTSVALLDPRAAPVVAYVVVKRAADPTVNRVVVTLFRSSSGQWAVDDLTVVDN